jgi:DNA-directed RNA polymerase specialized sigma24 family protein
MADEARFTWEAFITAPENAHLLKRYAKSAKEPAPLFDSIGEDLAGSNQEVRERAWRVLIVAMPVLTTILYEREIREPGWRNVEGKDQQMVNRGENILSYLHRKFVVEHYFKIRGENGKDPRPLVHRIAHNWQKDGNRKRRRETPQDEEAALKIPDPSGSIEDAILENENRVYEERKRELRDWGFYRSYDEFALFETVYVDATPFSEVIKSNGISSEATLRQRFSRFRKYAVAKRDELFTFLLFMENFPIRGRFPKYLHSQDRFEWWIKLAKRSVQPRNWLNGGVADGENAIAVRPLTTGLHDAPAHIYLLALHKELLADIFLEHIKTQTIYKEKNGVKVPFCDLLTLDNKKCLRYIDKLIDPKSRGLQQRRYMYRRLSTLETELPCLDAAADELRGDYRIWLISNSVPDPLRVHEWRYGEKPVEISLRESKERDVEFTQSYYGELLSHNIIWSMILIGANNRYIPL